MVPIGLVTRNRVAYLDVTLRSLSATKLPADVSLTIFDDASDDPVTNRYFSTTREIPVPRHWPGAQSWLQLGLGAINEHDVVPRGLKGRVHVDCLGKKSLGVVEASCEAVRRLFAAVPDAPGVMLLQDDVVFNDDWYGRMLGMALHHSFGKPLGVLAGLKLNKRYKIKRPHKVMPSGITGQCLFISREAFDKLDMFRVTQDKRMKFDDLLHARCKHNDLWVGVIMPFVCQHFGMRSLVRPKRQWHHNNSGRVGHYAHPPYVLAMAVREFP